MNIEAIQQAISRDLTAAERRTIEWLAGWENETQKNVMTLILAANWQGKTVSQ
ncbi:hypothetical protein [Paenibacillus daejeonensis]|uniref:hypothetical protein n=1 Tax=Paenibacillus daejeonensis TaxID=135193 RepID=UPI00037F722C|nr:hypothetical protein [Paenibacillus daejeonensis]